MVLSKRLWLSNGSTCRRTFRRVGRSNDQISNLQVDKETHLHRTLNSYWTWCSAIFLGGWGWRNSPWTISLISYTAYVGEYLLYLRYLDFFDDYVNYVFGICCDNMATHSPMAAMFFLTSARSLSLDARNFWILPRVTSSTNSQWVFWILVTKLLRMYYIPEK